MELNDSPFDPRIGEHDDFDFVVGVGVERGGVLRQLREINSRLLIESHHVQQSSEDLRQVLQALADLEQRYRAIGDLIPFGIWVTTRDGEPTFVSSSFLDLVGRSLESLKREGLEGRMPDAEYARLRADWTRVISAGSPWDHEFRVRGKDRRYRWVLSRGVPLRDQAGRITCWIGINLDITERRRAEAERSRLLAELQRRASELDATVDALVEGLVICDSSGAIVRLNTSAERILGLDPSERTLPLEELARRLRVETPLGTPVAVDELPISRALRGEVVRDEVLVIHDRDRTTWIRMAASPIHGRSRRVTGAAATFADVTAQHEQEQTRQAYIQAISHDLRTPLSVIQGHTQLLARMLEMAGQAGPVIASLAAIDAAARRINRMVQHLIEVGRLEAGQMKPRLAPVDLRELALDLQNQLRGTHEGSRLIVEAPPSLPAVRADPDHVARVLFNLVANALAYSPPDSRVAISFAVQEADVVTSVTDQGPGLPPEELTRIFDRYYRSRTSAGRGQGLGLGLFIARELIEAQGGRIWVVSEVGAGSTFSFSLPRVQ